MPTLCNGDVCGGAWTYGIGEGAGSGAAGAGAGAGAGAAAGAGAGAGAGSSFLPQAARAAAATRVARTSDFFISVSL